MKARSILTVTATLLTWQIVLADNVKLKIRRIHVDDNVYTPYYDAETEQDNEPGAAQRWLRLAVEYSTTGGWIDELSVRHLALVPNHNGEKAALLDEEVTYLNVGPGNHVSYVYMHPNCVKRYESKAKEVDSAVIFHIDEKIVGEKSTNKNKIKDWTKEQTTHTGHLLDESETPFWFINYDYKEMIKHRPHNGQGDHHKQPHKKGNIHEEK